MTRKKRNKKPDTTPDAGDRQNEATDGTFASENATQSTGENPPAQPEEQPEEQPDMTQEPDAETVPMERLLRLQADFDNYRKRMARDHKALTERATEDLMTELLPVLDNFDVALKHTAEKSTDAAVIEGFRIVAEQLENVLRKFGLQPVPAEDVPFDPHQHEAVAHIPDTDRPEGMIVAQTRRGFRLGDKLIRAAQVVVSSGTPPAQPDNAIPAETQED